MTHPYERMSEQREKDMDWDDIFFEVHPKLNTSLNGHFYFIVLNIKMELEKLI